MDVHRARDGVGHHGRPERPRTRPRTRRAAMTVDDADGDLSRGRANPGAPSIAGRRRSMRCSTRSRGWRARSRAPDPEAHAPALPGGGRRLRDVRRVVRGLVRDGAASDIHPAPQAGSRLGVLSLQVNAATRHRPSAWLAALLVCELSHDPSVTHLVRGRPRCRPRPAPRSFGIEEPGGGTLGGAAMAPPAPAAAPEPRGESQIPRYFAGDIRERHYGSVMVDRAGQLVACRPQPAHRPIPDSRRSG